MRTWHALFVVVVMTGLSSSGGAANQKDPYAAARAALVREIEADVRATQGYLGKDELDPRVIDALSEVPRHEFVPDDLDHVAYRNRPLPIGYNQTISQPYIVAIMTDLLGVFDGGKVLEVGTGSGYQAAVLGQIGLEVYSIEIVEPLGLATKELLGQLGYKNIHVKVGDGYAGWPDHAPFDGIIVTAAAEHVPEPLIEQLKPGGRIVIPVKRRFRAQELMVIEKDAAGEIDRQEILPVMFVPLTRDSD